MIQAVQGFLRVAVGYLREMQAVLGNAASRRRLNTSCRDVEERERESRATATAFEERLGSALR